MGIGFSEPIEFINGDAPSGGAPELVPFIFSDFENGIHQVDGVAVAVTDIWTAHGDWGAWSESDIDGDGLMGFDSPILDHAVTTGILENMSVICELSVGEAAAYIAFQTFDSPAYETEATVTFASGSGGISDRIKAYNNQQQNGDAGVLTRRKVGATLTAASYKVVSQGGTVYSKNASAERIPAPTEFLIDMSASDIARVHNITIYSPALSDAQLQALTA